jgi:O-antigen ligase
MYVSAFPNSVKPRKKLLILFAAAELGVILTSSFLGFNFALVAFSLAVFLVLVILPAKITLMILLALSAFVSYDNTTALALGIAILILVLAALSSHAYMEFCLRGVRMAKGKLYFPLTTFLAIVLLNSARGLLHSYKLTYWGLETFAYLSFGLVVLITTFFTSTRDIRRFFRILVFLTILQSIYGVVIYTLAGHRIGGTAFGIIPSMIAVALLNLFFYSKDKRKRRLYLLLALLPVLHLLFSFTRGYWLGFLVALAGSYALYVYQLKRGLRWTLFAFLRGAAAASVGFLLGLIVVIGHVGFLDATFNRFRSAFSISYSEQTTSNYQRLIEYEGTIRKISEKPIWGHGLGYGFELRDWIAQERYTVRAVHHDYLAILLKMGIVGLLAFLWFFYEAFKNGLKTWGDLTDEYFKGLSAGFLSNVLQLLIIGFTNHVFIGVMNTFYLAFAVGAVERMAQSGPTVERRDGFSHSL